MQNIDLDIIKGLAIVAIILIHTSYFYAVPPLFFIGFEMLFFIVVIGVTHMFSLKTGHIPLANISIN